MNTMVAMAQSKELTNHSLPGVGYVFGGRDHTTVFRACDLAQHEWTPR